MTIQDESTRTTRLPHEQKYNRYDRRHVEEFYAGLSSTTMAGLSTSASTSATSGEMSPLLLNGSYNNNSRKERKFFTRMSNRWLPNPNETGNFATSNYYNSNRAVGVGGEEMVFEEGEDEIDDGGDDKDEDDKNATGEDDSDSGSESEDGSEIPGVRFDTYQGLETDRDYPSTRTAVRGSGSGSGRNEPRKWKGKILHQHTPHYTTSLFNKRGVIRRPMSRRLFLFLTEPTASFGSAVFFFVLMVTICISNIIMICQTMDVFQFMPADCHSCGGDQDYAFDDDSTISHMTDHQCVCQPQPYPYLERWLHILMIFFAIEWTLRVSSYTPARPKKRIWKRFIKWFQYLTSLPVWIDALAIWPHFFATSLPKGLLSLRLLRLFRVFSLVRLGQYNELFISLTNVLVKSFEYLKLMMIVLVFGGFLFGSLVYWVEKGQWKYWEETGQFQFVRFSADGVTEEISPFDSIPTSFWWFLVTATTVGYGDLYPTTTAGRFVGILAMLTGVLVLAFPVSVFSDLWSEELKQSKGFKDLYRDDNEDDDDDINAGTKSSGQDGIMRENDNLERVRSAVRNDDETYLRQSKLNHLTSSTTQQPSLSSPSPSSSPYIVMEKSDLDQIVTSLHEIRENQTMIRSILRKYYNIDPDNVAVDGGGYYQ